MALETLSQVKTDEQLRYERARERVQELKGFYTHLIVYILVNATIILFDYVISPGPHFYFFPLVGWGIGLMIHGLHTWLGKSWEERKIRELMERDKGLPEPPK